ncbi:glycine zipper family protein [Shewanella sp. GXUN23E]|uniref:glycine zipper family protein n=1 Tax=Shewanella sp. GXUN23E TaxID=3422498 RepID=UPI003D7E6D44
MNHKLLAGIGMVILVTSGCAYNQKPVVDMTGVDTAQYQQDFEYCQQFASQVDKGESMRTASANGAAVGGVSGGVWGAMEDGGEGALTGALAGVAVGALSGAMEGAVSAKDAQARVLRQCLLQKGYRVYDL